MEAFEVWKFIHILAAMTWVGGAVMAQVFAYRLKTAAPEHRLRFAKDMGFVTTWVFLPASIVIYLAGSLAVEEVRPAFDYDQAWIGIGTIGVILGFLFIVTFAIPQTRKAIRMIEAGEGPAAAPMIRRVSLSARVILVILLVVVWAMVVKPGV
jgi:uncharacterized membrane protein